MRESNKDGKLNLAELLSQPRPARPRHRTLTPKKIDRLKSDTKGVQDLVAGAIYENDQRNEKQVAKDGPIGIMDTHHNDGGQILRAFESEPIERAPLQDGISMIHDGSNLFDVAADVVSQNPEKAFYFFNEKGVAQRAHEFLTHFMPGDDRGVVAPAVKATSRNRVLRVLYEAGISAFECSFPSEVERMQELAPGSTLWSTNPLKTKEAILEFARRRINYFTADDIEEVEKLITTIDTIASSDDLNIALRLDTGKNTHAAIDLASKFGAEESEIANMARIIRYNTNADISLAMHLGSQNTSPKTYQYGVERGSRLAKQLKGMDRERRNIDVLNLGGGFPIEILGRAKPPELEEFLRSITDAVNQVVNPAFERVAIEPGRAMVGPNVDLFIPVLKVRKQRDFSAIYIPEGPFKSFNTADGPNHDADFEVWRMTSSGLEQVENGGSREFVVFDDTCDSMGVLNNTRKLPNSIKEGDYLRHKNAGAYTDGYSVSPDTYGKLGYNGAPHTQWVAFNLL